MPFPALDIFCTIVDNYGDGGFSYRLARSYKKRHPERTVRLFVDQPEALQHMRLADDRVEIVSQAVVPAVMAPLVVETFGCTVPDPYLEKIKKETKLWINIEYLSAEPWTANVHGKESPQGIPGLKKIFYMPGFSANTGGILTDFVSSATNTANTVSVFTYRQDFSALLNNLPPSTLLIFDTYAQDILRTQQNKFPQHTFIMQPFVSQDAYDTILAGSTLNLVRGEESLVRAILAGKPFLWQAYPQDNNHQLVKTAAFLELFKPHFSDARIFEAYRTLTQAWNGDSAAISVDNWPIFLENLPSVTLATRAFGRYLRQNCDMGVLFDQFITQNW